MDRKRKIFEEAKRTVTSRKRLSEMVAASLKKVKTIAIDSPELQELKSKINVLTSMVQHHLSGKYNAFSNTSLLLVVFGLLYFVTPTDVIPDFIPALGFTDDASILLLIYKKVSRDIDRFIQWKETA